jgi:hypothetical protein
MSEAYATDYYGWTREQADALARRSANELDWENLREEVEGLGKQQRSELHSHLKRLLQHLLKWRYQEARRSRSWTLTVAEQRAEAERVVQANPSLKPELGSVLQEAYRTARIAAARDTKLPISTFPDQPPFTFEEAMTEPVEWTAPEPQRRSRTRKTKA